MFSCSLPKKSEGGEFKVNDGGEFKSIRVPSDWFLELLVGRIGGHT